MIINLEIHLLLGSCLFYFSVFYLYLTRCTNTCIGNVWGFGHLLLKTPFPCMCNPCSPQVLRARSLLFMKREKYSLKAVWELQRDRGLKGEVFCSSIWRWARKGMYETEFIYTAVKYWLWTCNLKHIWLLDWRVMKYCYPYWEIIVQRTASIVLGMVSLITSTAFMTTQGKHLKRMRSR